jgi:cellulose synthase/poly-beta-1,6-N-acetylglucosamine synthase-like glycosyltransferase
MLSLAWDAWTGLNSYSLVLLSAGVLLAVVINCRKWRSDRGRATQLRASLSAPVRLSRTPRVTIVASAWNESDQIAAHLQSVRALRYPNKDYVLCAGGSDGTLDLAKSQAAPWMTILEQRPGEGHTRAFARTLSHAAGAIVFLTDADSRLNDYAFEKTLEPLIEQGESASTGACEPLPEEMRSPFVLERWFIDLYAQSRTGRYTRGFLGCNSALTREALETARDFDAQIDSGADYYLAKLAIAAGQRIRFVPESRVSTEYSHTFSEYCRRQSRWLWSVAALGWKFGCYSEVARCLRTPVVGLAMLAGGVIGAWQRGFLLACWCGLFLHAVLSRFRYIRFGECLSAVRYGNYAGLPLAVLRDFVTWAMSGVAFVVPRMRGWR